MSAGGNDALQASGLFSAPVQTGAEALLEIAKIRQKFDADYRAVLKALSALRLPLAVCTIYDPNFPIDLQQRISVTGLAFFNDCITRAAVRSGLPLIDLRVLFTDPGRGDTPQFLAVMRLAGGHVETQCVVTPAMVPANGRDSVAIDVIEMRRTKL